MATFEEQILGYLDGTATSADREAVARGIASKGSAERALFDAHLRLEELYAAIQPPVSAPLALQRELAAKLPILAVKLPYLAQPEDRRRSAAFWMNFKRSTWVNLFLLLAALLLAGGIWYAISPNGRFPSIQPANGTAVGSAGNRSEAAMPNHVVPNAKASAAKPLSESLLKNQATPSLEGTSARLHSHRAGAISSHSIIGGTTMHRIIGHSSTNASGSILAKSAMQQASNVVQSPNEATSLQSHSLQPEEHGSNSEVGEHVHSAIPNAVDESSELPPLQVNMVTVPDRTLNYSMHRDILNPYPIEESSSSYIPLRVFAAPQERIIAYPATLSAHVLNNKIGNTSGTANALGGEVGIDYELSPWLALGIRAGQTILMQYQPLAYSSSNLAGHYGLIDEDHDSYINTISGNWTALAGTWTFNPADPVRISATLAGGPTLTAQSGWIGMGSVAFEHDLSNAFRLRGEVSYDLSHINPLTPSTIPTNGSIESFSTVSTPSALTSRAIGFSVGISFHP